MTVFKGNKAAYPAVATDKLRYGDCDPQGHVNNAVFSTFLETGRTEMLYAGDEPIVDDGCGYVIARLELDYLAELTWPGSVEIGTRIAELGRSSVKIVQEIFQDGVAKAQAHSVLVQVNLTTRRSQALSERALNRLTALK
ncbi:acyl-CoA thioesterase [Roseibium sp.]|uniref:acyl-CoA thioesterase n=1 Tax=Roseibium sp. TaxID=1936156 RepID=UPI003A96C80D